MNTSGGGSAVLMPAGPGRAGAEARKRLDRRHLIAAVAAGLLLHGLIVLGFWLYDVLRVRDIGDWSGPVLVKIGAPEAPESPLPDPGPLPETAEDAVDRPAEAAEEPSVEDAAGGAAPSESVSGSRTADTVSSDGGTGTGDADASSPARETSPPPPARVQGSEEGNNYLINFEGTEGEVGRAGAYDYIVSYMPLPEVLPRALVDGASEYLRMSPSFIRSEIEVYWELQFGEYVKKKGWAGTVPYKDRPYYWGILTNSLGYDPADADWRTPGMRSVEVEFTVRPSSGPTGADLDDIIIKRPSNNPRVDEAVKYGLSQWVYYNDTDRDIRARMVYDFED